MLFSFSCCRKGVFGALLILDIGERPKPTGGTFLRGGNRRGPHQMPSPGLIVCPEQP